MLYTWQIKIKITLADFRGIYYITTLVYQKNSTILIVHLLPLCGEIKLSIKFRKRFITAHDTARLNMNHK